MTHNITVEGGTSVRLTTSGKYCDRDIVVMALSGGVQLPELTNPGSDGDLMEGKQLLDGSGKPVTGTFTLDSEMSAQDSLIEQIKNALQGKAAGGGGGDPDLPAGYARCAYIQFDGNQIVDTGIICNQDTEIKIAFSREKSTQHYLCGVASSDNTASVTIYLGGSWRFGDKFVTKNPATNADMIYSGILSKSKLTMTGSSSSISGVNDFETIGSILIGTARSASGEMSEPQFEGKVLFFVVRQGDEQVLNLVPITDGNGIYRFWDAIGKQFYDSITDTPLKGGNL